MVTILFNIHERSQRDYNDTTIIIDDSSYTGYRMTNKRTYPNPNLILAKHQRLDLIHIYIKHSNI